MRGKKKKLKWKPWFKWEAKFGTGLYKLSVFGVGTCERRGKRERDGDR